MPCVKISRHAIPLTFIGVKKSGHIGPYLIQFRLGLVSIDQVMFD